MFIENYLDFIVNKHLVEPSDSVILTSISKQVNKGIALTDRQFALVKEKLSKYRHVFEQNNFEFNEKDLETTKLPLRQIDRTKEIKIIDMKGVPYIEIRFPFNKKEIVKVEKLVSINKKNYFHTSGSNTHCIKFSANACANAVELFSANNFVIEKMIVDIANEANAIKNNKNMYAPRIENSKFFNVNKSLQQSLCAEIESDLDNPLLLKDRAFRYGLEYQDLLLDESLAAKIASRETSIYNVDPEFWSLSQTIEAILQLQRSPILVLIDDDSSYEQLKEMYNIFKNNIPDEKQSVLFREDSENNKNRYVNDFVKNHNLNNWIDNTTKVIYIKKSKLPKLLLKDQIKPMCVLGKTSLRNSLLVEAYIMHVCDLIVYHDKTKPNLFFGKNYW